MIGVYSLAVFWLYVEKSTVSWIVPNTNNVKNVRMFIRACVVLTFLKSEAKT